MKQVYRRSTQDAQIGMNTGLDWYFKIEFYNQINNLFVIKHILCQQTLCN